MHPKTHEDWARSLAVRLESVLMSADPESLELEFDQHREALDRYSFWHAEKSGQIRLPIAAAHGCHEEESE